MIVDAGAKPRATGDGGELPIAGSDDNSEQDKKIRDADEYTTEQYWKYITRGRPNVERQKKSATLQLRSVPIMRPVLVILYGPPGVGKSRCIKSLMQDQSWNHDDFVHLDPDELRRWGSTEYRNSVSGVNAYKLNNKTKIKNEAQKQEKLKNSGFNLDRGSSKLLIDQANELEDVLPELKDMGKKGHKVDLVPTPWRWSAPGSDVWFQSTGYTVDNKFLTLSQAVRRSQHPSQIWRKKQSWDWEKSTGNAIDLKQDDNFVDRAFQEGYNFIYDTAGYADDEGNLYYQDEMIRRAKSVREHNYRVVVSGCYAPWRDVVARGESRAKLEGRATNLDFASKIYGNMYPIAYSASYKGLGAV